MSTAYQIKLPQFEGPFDLLLFFIERDELDIYNIPIFKLTNDFLDYIHTFESLNIEQASEFILFVSTLMRIKAKMLLPRRDLDAQGNEIDPRMELVDKILEYKRFKEASEEMVLMEAERLMQQKRGNIRQELEAIGQEHSEGTEITTVTVYKLMQAYERVMKRFKERNNKPQHVVVKYNYSMEGQRAYLLDYMKVQTRVSFEGMFAECTSRIQAIFTLNNLFAQQYENEPLPAAPARHHKYTNGKVDLNKIRFGVYFAPNISWLHPTSSKSDDQQYTVNSNGGKFGYAWGLMADYYFAENYGISTGFNLNTSGGQIVSGATNKVDTTKANVVKNANFSYTLQYLEIPVALKLRSDPLNDMGIRLFGQIGLTLGINISRKADYTVNYNDTAAHAQVASGTNEKLLGTLAVAPVMLQMNLGMGIEYPIKQKLAFYFGVFFNNGFLPTAINPQNYNMGYNGTFTGTNTRLNSLAFRLGLFF